MRNLSYENEYDLHSNGLVSKTHFHMKGFALGLVLKQRQKTTRKWPILSPASASLLDAMLLVKENLVPVLRVNLRAQNFLFCNLQIFYFATCRFLFATCEFILFAACGFILFAASGFIIVCSVRIDFACSVRIYFVCSMRIHFACSV